MLSFWLFFIISLSVVFIAVGISIFLRRYGKAAHIQYLTVYLGCASAWIAASVMEVLVVNESWIRFWAVLGGTFGIFAIAWLFIFIFYYLDHQIKTRMLVFQLGLAGVFSIIRWTNRFHLLYFTTMTTVQTGSAILLKREYGPLFSVMIGIDALIVLFVLIKVAQCRLLTHKVFHRQMHVFSVFTIVMIAYSLLTSLGFIMPILPFLPILVMLPGLGFTLSALRSNNINLTPMPRTNVLDMIHDALIVISPDGILLDINREMSNLINKDWPKAVGNPLQSLFPELAARIDDALQLSIPLPKSASRPYKHRFIFRHRDKQYDTSIYDHHSNYLVLLHDITPLMRSLSNTNQLARNDALTGIHNRRSIEAAVQQWLNQQQDTDSSFCFALFDVDHFKQFNDTYGHQVGDEVLKQITAIFTHAIRATDLFGRFGGDEFILFLGDVTEDQAQMILERAVLMIAKRQIVLETGTLLSPTISMGAVFFPTTGSLAYDEIFLLTDEALYTAKANGRNQICFRRRTRINFDNQALY